MSGKLGCSNYYLAILNGIYVVVAFILIGVAAHAKAAAKITSLGIAGGIIACGVFLLIIAIIGLVGALKHHQVLLFLYMVVLSLLFIIQFSIACACLALNKNQQHKLLKAGWRSASDDVKSDVQFAFNCCGFDTFNFSGTATDPDIGHPSCDSVPGCCPTGVSVGCCLDDWHCSCLQCNEVLYNKIDKALHAAGSVGLACSFLQILGVIFAFVARCSHKEQQDQKVIPPKHQFDTSWGDPQHTNHI